ncbi:Proline--tRNA ligase [subsurface metagenome]
MREFIMKDLYSFDADEEGLDISYREMLTAYQNIYRRCGLPAIMVEADSGAIGGKDSHEFMVITDTGEDELLYCEKCGYSANVEKAESVTESLPEEEPLPVEAVATPGMATIEEVSGFLGVPRNKTMKAVFYQADGELVFVVIRGDIEVNETKLKNTLKCNELTLATEAAITAAGIVAGSASAIGLKGIKIIADESITSGANFVAGANKPDIHLKNVNYPRDFKADIVTDIAKARVGEGCPKCNNRLSSTRGIEVGHIFKLGTVFSQQLGANFMDASGISHPIIMGCYGIGLERMIAAAIEQNHDDKGIIWPLPIAPYQIYLCPLYRENSQVAGVAEKLYAELEAQGLEVLFDDRNESPGIKFNDADLLGIPFRLTVSPRSLEKNSAELKKRAEKQFELLPLEGVAGKIKEMVRGELSTSPP